MTLKEKPDVELPINALSEDDRGNVKALLVEVEQLALRVGGAAHSMVTASTEATSAHEKATALCEEIRRAIEAQGGPPVFSRDQRIKSLEAMAEMYKRDYLDLLPKMKELSEERDRLARTLSAVASGTPCQKDTDCTGTMKYTASGWAKCDVCGFTWRPG